MTTSTRDTKNKPLPISIIIPTKNEQKNIHRLLGDIQRQSRQPSEIIIADAGSTDNTKTVSKKFGAIVTKGGSPSQGRNRGVQISKQEILLFMDADTGIGPIFFLEDIYNRFQKKNLDCATCYFEPIDRDNSFSTNLTIWIMNRLKDIGRLPIKNLKLGFGAFIMVKKSAFLSVGGFREDMKYLEDSQFTRDITQAGFKYKLIPLKIQLDVKKESIKHPRKSLSLVLAFAYGVLSLILPCGKLQKSIYKKAEKLYLSVEKTKAGD